VLFDEAGYKELSADVALGEALLAPLC
jgi:hypothetical protein